MRAAGRAAAALVLLAAAVRTDLAQSPPRDGQAAGSSLRFLAPSAGDLPVGATRVEVAGENLQPGDQVDIFVDGRKIGSVSRPPWEVRWDVGEALRSHVLVAVLVRAGREVASARLRTRDPGFTGSAKVLAVALTPIVTDRAGRYVLGLGQKDFAVFDDGEPQRIDAFEATDSPLAAILALDVSASMLPKLEAAAGAAHAFVDAFKPDDEVGFFAFNSTVVGKVDLTRDRAAVHVAIDAVQPDGETAIYDVLAAALRRLKAVKRRKAVILFTDGEDNRSRFSVDQVIAMARSSEASVYAVAQGVDESRTLTVFLNRIAQQTGGRSYFIGQIKSLPQTFGAIVQELRNQYFLTYTQKPPRPPRSWHHVDLTVHRPEVAVRFKREYFVE